METVTRKRIIRRKFPRRAGETGWRGPAGSYESPVQKEGERGTSRTWSSGEDLGFRGSLGSFRGSFRQV